MIRIINKHWPFIIALGVLWATITVLLIFSTRQNQGHLIYTLDDPYIHMAIAKNFVQHRVFGVDSYGFTSSSTSPLWLLLLSLIYLLFGVNEVSPFIFNILFGTLIVYVVYHLLRKYISPPYFTLLVLLSIIFFTSLPSLIFCGHEHTMHALLTILFVYLSAKNLSSDKSTSKEYMLSLILAPLVASARYEGLFLVLVVSTLFILRKRFLHSLFLCGLGVLPIVIYGIISISHGWYFLPNSVLLKGNMPDFSSLKGVFRLLGEDISHTPHILFLVIGALIIFIFQYTRKKKMWKTSPIMFVIFIPTTVLHMQFASTDWFFRYEAYLVALGIFVIAIGIQEYLHDEFSLKIYKLDKSQIPKHLALLLLLIIIISPFAKRGLDSLISTPRATTNIYEQQYQMGLFLKKFYQAKCVAANDIGAINYLADIECLDLWGLSNVKVAKLKREQNYKTQHIYDLAKQKNAKIAIVYDHFFNSCGGLPPQWIKVGEWRIFNNIICAGDRVSFYAVDSLEENNLIHNIISFSSYLPENVLQIVKAIE